MGGEWIDQPSVPMWIEVYEQVYAAYTTYYE